MQTVPNPQTHIFGNQKSLVGNLVIIHISGNVDKSGQLLVDGVVGSPHPIVVVIGAIHLYEGRVVGWDGIQIAVSILGILFLMLVKGLPCTLHLAQLGFGGKIACLPIASQGIAPHERTLLALAQLVHHTTDTATQGIFGRGIVGTGKGKGKSRHVVTRAMSLQLGGRRVPSVSYGISVCRQTIRVAIVVELLAHVPTENRTDGQIAVTGQAVFSLHRHKVERKRFGHGLLRGDIIHILAHLDLRFDRITLGGGRVAQDIPLHTIFTTSRIEAGICHLLLCSQSTVHPFDLTELSRMVTICHPQLIRQTGHRAHG